MREMSCFLHKRCKLVKNDGFTLYGIIIEIEQFGVVLKTNQETSFISFLNIKELRLDNGG